MSDAEWRQFEQLVARIEEIAAPRGAIVKSPDRIRDLTTGRLREVDASIRYTVGTADILITVECRKRSRKADDTWIEQLATKRRKIGAAKTIAVSAAGFSDSAKLTAKQNGIDLRTLSEVTGDDLQSWFMPVGAVHVFRKIEKMKCVVVFEQPDGDPTPKGYVIPDEFEPVFYHESIASPFPAATLFHLYELQSPETFSAVPFDGSLVRVEFGVTLPGLTVKSRREAMIPVHHARFSADVGYESAVCELESGSHHRYSLPDGEIQHTTFEATLFGLPFEFSHQGDSTGEKHVSFRVKKKKSEDPRT